MKNDSEDQMMRLWLSMPESVYPATVEKVKDGRAQFDINQPSLRGVIQMENGNEVPFFCVRIEVCMDPHRPHTHCGGRAVLTVFRHETGWVTTFMAGLQPSFSLDHRVPNDPQDLLNRLLAGQQAMSTRMAFRMV